MLALGMLVISTTQASDLVTPDTSALVDDADDLPALTLVESPTLPPDPPSAQTELPAPVAPQGRRPEIMIFRPPRAAAFV